MIATSLSRAADRAAPHREELRRRMARPQRHRLLQGYPMLPLMGPAPDPAPDERAWADPARPVIVGVLPHPFCNPAVRGCGFCTFPHEAYGNDRARAVVARVAREVALDAGRAGARRRVEALYFGGGTANLTPPDAFAALCGALAGAFDLRHAEVTLEGVPAYFLARDGALLGLLAGALPARHRRVSLGVQTFDPATLARMGRAAFGDAGVVGRVVEAAHALGMTASADLLVNLPGQPYEAMARDVETALALGFDQVCVYHLVLFEGLGTAWSEDRSLLAARPAPDAASAHWLALRDLLLARGFVQTTLTNFERREVAATPRAFAYEPCSFRPDAYDAQGYGPGAVTTRTVPARGRGVKRVNHATADAYVRAIDAGGRAVDRWFEYAPVDLALLHATRSLSLLAVSRERYRASLGRDVVADFAPALDALADAGLITVDAHAVRLTPRGMFYADSAAGLLAWRRVEALRGGVPPLDPAHEAGRDPMG